MSHSDPALVACLSHLAGDRRHAAYHCSLAVLEQLQRLGLIQSVPGAGLPLGYPHPVYRLTPAGKAYMKSGASTSK